MQQVNDAPRRAPRCVWSTFEKRHTTTYATTSAIANVRCNSPKTAGSAVPKERKSGVSRMEKNQAKQNEAPTTPATR